jgi:hypothetical protein
MPNGRCKVHGGKSTGPRTPEGLERSRRANSEVTRERIRAGVIIDRFQKHFMGKLELTPTQIRVGEVLLRKVIPDLTHTDLSTTSTRRYVVEVPPQLSDEEWEKKYSLPAPALNSVQ